MAATEEVGADDVRDSGSTVAMVTEEVWAMTAPAELLELGKQVLAILAADKVDLNDFRGVAFHEPRKDDQIRAAAQFGPSVGIVAVAPHIGEHIGANEAERFTLQFVFEAVRMTSEGRTIDDATTEVWSNLLAEAADPDGHFAGVANLRHIEVDVGLVPRTVGSVRVAPRSFDDLSVIGFSEFDLEGLTANWTDGGGHSEHVVVGEAARPQRPDRMLVSNDPNIWVDAQRLLGALRLLGPGAA